MTDTALTPDQQQRAEALNRAASTIRGTTFASRTPIAEQEHTALLTLAEWILTGLDDVAEAEDATPSQDEPETYKCPGCGDDHELAAALDRLMDVAARDVRRVVVNLRDLGFGATADDLEKVVASDAFRVAMRDAFIKFNEHVAGKIDAGLDRLMQELLNTDPNA